MRGFEGRKLIIYSDRVKQKCAALLSNRYAKDAVLFAKNQVVFQSEFFQVTISNTTLINKTE